MREIKKKAKIVFYVLASIGIIDMFIYSVTQGDFKLIHSFLGFVFN